MYKIDRTVFPCINAIKFEHLSAFQFIYFSNEKSTYRMIAENSCKLVVAILTSFQIKIRLRKTLTNLSTRTIRTVGMKNFGRPTVVASRLSTQDDDI